MSLESLCALDYRLSLLGLRRASEFENAKEFEVSCSCAALCASKCVWRVWCNARLALSLSLSLSLKKTHALIHFHFLGVATASGSHPIQRCATCNCWSKHEHGSREHTDGR